MVKIYFRQKKLNRKWDVIEKEKNCKREHELRFFVESQTILETESTVLVKKYAEIFIQFGYITMFAPVFPLAPLFSFLCNLLELKITMNSLAYNNKRNIAQPSSGIGYFKNILAFLSVISIPVNCGIVFYTSDSLPGMLNLSPSED